MKDRKRKRYDEVKHLNKLLIYKRGEGGEGLILFTNRPFAAGGHMVQNPKY